MTFSFGTRRRGANRLAFLDDQGGVIVQEVDNNPIPTVHIRNNEFDVVVSGDFDQGGPDDLFFWGRGTGKNRHVRLIDHPITGHLLLMN